MRENGKLVEFDPEGHGQIIASCRAVVAPYADADFRSYPLIKRSSF